MNKPHPTPSTLNKHSAGSPEEDRSASRAELAAAMSKPYDRPTTAREAEVMTSALARGARLLKDDAPLVYLADRAGNFLAPLEREPMPDVVIAPATPEEVASWSELRIDGRPVPWTLPEVRPLPPIEFTIELEPAEVPALPAGEVIVE